MVMSVLHPIHKQPAEFLVFFQHFSKIIRFHSEGKLIAVAKHQPFRTSAVLFGNPNQRTHLGIYFAKVIESFKTDMQDVGSEGLSELRIIDIILITNQKERFEEAYTILQNFPSIRDPMDDLPIPFNDTLFYLCDLGARLCFAMKKLSEAKHWAVRAIELAQIKDPQLPRHPTVGLVKASKKQISLLKQIAGAD